MLPIKQIDALYQRFEEPYQTCFLLLRDVILKQDKAVVESIKYGMPFFSLHEKVWCYLWVHKKHKSPYIGFMDGHKMDDPALLQEKRSRIKILLIDPEQDLPIAIINKLLNETKMMRCA